MSAQLELGGRSLKGQLKQAARLEARYVAILDGEGMRLRDMETHEQQDVESAAALVARVIKGRHPG
jgi:histidyl-tRNA synthetase